MHWLRRGFIGLLVVAATLIGAGLIYQIVTTRIDQREHPPPGKMVDVGGFAMHIHCTGAGTPTVILESLSGGFSSYWGWVQPAVATTTRVCSYDRAGRAWSQSDPLPQTLQRTADNLHRLLARAATPGPYVLVGHSIGGLYVRRFVADFPGEVVGMVLVDAAHPEQLERIPAIAHESDNYLRFAGVIPWLAHLGVGHLFFAMRGEIDFADLTEPQKGEIKAAWSSPEYFVSQRAEMVAAPDIYAQARRLGRLGDLPLIVITRGRNLDDDWPTLQNELAALSKNSRHISVSTATHGSLVFSPNDSKFVSDAIVQVVTAARTGEPLAP